MPRIPRSRPLGWLLASLFAVPAQASADAFGERLAAAAASQIGVTTGYDPSYRRLTYPGGDVPASTGVCSDVLIRAYRALGIDLQQRVHKDMRRAFATYPPLWQLRRPDPNIDHRRVPNLAHYFRRHGKALPPSQDPSAYRAGDIVTWQLPSGAPHIGIVSQPATQRSAARVIHNIGAGTREEEVLFAYPITGHYRYPTY